MGCQNRRLAVVSGRIEHVFETPATAVNGPGARPAEKELTINDSMPEEWRPVLGLEGAYEVSNLGRVRSLERTIDHPGNAYFAPHRRTLKGKLLISSAEAYGHVYTPRGQIRVHVLVCEAFHGPKPAPTYEVRHLNGDPSDNRPENLAWGTSAENTQDMMRHGTEYWSNKTHCKYGHEYTPENTCKGPRNTRGCLECTRRRAREGQRRLRARRRQCGEAA